MNSSYAHLRGLFRGILSTGLVGATAATGAGCQERVRSPYPAEAFDTAICVPQGDAWIEQLTPEPPVDALLVRDGFRSGVLEDGGIPDFAFELIHGTPCATAADEAACIADVNALATYPSLVQGTGDGPTGGPQLAFTRGDVVALVDGAESLRGLLGTIDTAAEAVLLASVDRTNYPVCDRTNLRAVANGFEVLVREGTGCGVDSDRYEVVIRVLSDGSVTEVGRRLIRRGDPNCVIGRLTDGVAIGAGRAATVGEHFARMAALEAAAVIAFDRLADELASFGAPSELVVRARRSARDEARHVALVDLQRARFGGARVDVSVAPHRVRSRVAIARENATEGMVRETYGALAASYHAEHAADAEVARLFRALAIDETRHAALARDVAAFLEPTLSDAERADVARARTNAAATLADAVAVDLGDDVHVMLGWPRPDIARAMIDALFPAAWS